MTHDPRLANATRAAHDPQISEEAIDAAVQFAGLAPAEMDDRELIAGALHAALPFLRGKGAAGGDPWQPIKTAPTDGSLILVYASPRDDLPGFITVCAYHEDAGFCVDELRYTTHWRPLPEPPVAIADPDTPTPTELAKAQSFREGYIEAPTEGWLPDTPDFDRRRGALAYYARVPYDPRQTDAWREGWRLSASAGWRPEWGNSLTGERP